MIAIGCDHGGYDLKQEVIKYLADHQLEYEDFGCYGKDSCDYPAFGQAVAKAVASGTCDRGIKVKGIRCALCSDTVSARLTREHNNANVLALGAGIVGPNLALSIVEAFLNTAFPGEEKHCRRVTAIQALEEETMKTTDET